MSDNRNVTEEATYGPVVESAVGLGFAAGASAVVLGSLKAAAENLTSNEVLNAISTLADAMQSGMDMVGDNLTAVGAVVALGYAAKELVGRVNEGKEHGRE